MQIQARFEVTITQRQKGRNSSFVLHRDSAARMGNKQFKTFSPDKFALSRAGRTSVAERKRQCAGLQSRCSSSSSSRTYRLTWHKLNTIASRTRYTIHKLLGEK